MLQGCGKLRARSARKICEETLETEERNGKVCWLVAPTPLPLLLKPATGAGFAKYVCKILSPKGLEVKILKTQHLAGPFWVHPRRRRCI